MVLQYQHRLPPPLLPQRLWRLRRVLRYRCGISVGTREGSQLWTAVPSPHCVPCLGDQAVCWRGTGAVLAWVPVRVPGCVPLYAWFQRRCP